MRNPLKPRAPRRPRSNRVTTKAWCVLSCVVMGLGVGLAPAAQSDDWNQDSRADEWWLKSLDISGAWEIAGQGTGQRICLVDSGVDTTQPDLQGATFADGTDISGAGARDGLRPVISEGDPGAKGHGTSMAAWIVGQGHGPRHSLGILGVAPKATIISVSQKYGMNSTEDPAQKALTYCAAHGATVVNFSNSDHMYPKDIAFALNHNMVVVQSNGNNSPDDDEYCSDNSLAPGELGVTGATPEWSPDPDTCPAGVPHTRNGRNPAAIGGAIAAPSSGPLQDDGHGDGLLAAIPKDSHRNDYALVGGGTSTAAAITSGIVALVRERYPHLSASAVIEKVMYHLQKPDSGTTGRTGTMGFGLIDPVAAVSGPAYEVTSNPLGDPRINSRGVWSGASFASFLKTQAPAYGTPSTTPSAGSRHSSATFSKDDERTVVWGIVIIVVVFALGLGFFVGLIVLIVVLARRPQRHYR